MNFNNNVDLGYSVYQFDELLDVYTYDINSESISDDNSDRRSDISYDDSINSNDEFILPDNLEELFNHQTTFANQENNLYLKLIIII